MKELWPRHALLAITDNQVCVLKFTNLQETLSRKLNQSSKNWKLDPATKVPATGLFWAGRGCARGSWYSPVSLDISRNQ